MHHDQDTELKKTSVLTRLRALAPRRRLTFAEAIQVAELQAGRLLELQGVCDAPVPDDVVTHRQRVRVEYDAALPTSVSGCSDWDRHRRSWVISLNKREPRSRRRFTMLHEYKHILDHGSPGLIGQPAPSQGNVDTPAVKLLADYFAACVLMPRRLVKAAWAIETQTISELALAFDVSAQAMEVRLNQLGLLSADDRPSADINPKQYSRASSAQPAQYFRTTTWPRSLLQPESAR